MVALAKLLEPFSYRETTSQRAGSLSLVEVSGISDDSRDVRPGDLFVAVAGAAADGHRYAKAAVTGGAVAVLAEHELADVDTVPVLVMPELNYQRGALAARVFGFPSRTLQCIGVTGTNGKTSIACFIADLLGALGERAAYMGTIGWGRLDKLESAALTTESAIRVQQRMARLLEEEAGWVVMEVSSHALDQRRVDAVEFGYAVFSNLTRDHLDYHGDYDAYAAAKARLFSFGSLKAAVVNVDDAFGRQLAANVKQPVDLISYGAQDADICWSKLICTQAGVAGRWHTPWGETEFIAPVYGTFSVANLSAAVGVLCHAGFPLADVVTAVRELRRVPGRMEFFGLEPGIVVDYAHTPDALEKMLCALRAHVQGRLICVFGCGGDRDQGKRPLMARAASRFADVVWLTSDNPRSEDPEVIIDAMRSGLIDSAIAFECVDRLEAIKQAVASAGREDLVVIAGKGHEEYQEIEGRRLPFSDRAIASGLCREIG